MIRNEIIAKTLTKIRSRFKEHEEPYSEKPDWEEIVTAELQQKLPDTEINTCEDFPCLKVECCDTCHQFYPHYEVSLIDVQDGSKAWVCDPVKDAIYSESLKQAEHR